MTDTVKELQARRDVAARTKKLTDRAIADLNKIKVPDGARGEKQDLREALQDAKEHQSERIHDLTEKIKDKKEDHGGAAAAVKWALSQVGVTETPYGSNWGHPVQDWIQFLGYTESVPWCGCFAGYAAIAKGGASIPSRIRLGYAGYIAEDARAGRNGLRAVPFAEAQPGDILVFWGNQHIGLCRSKPVNGSIGTVEGNTSSNMSGSQSNGGGVYAKTRMASDVTCVARPAY